MCPEPQREPGKLLLSVDEGSGSLAAVRALRAAGYETWLAISQPDTYAARSRAAAGVLRVAVPKLDVERHVRELSKAAERLRVAAVLPGTEGSLRAVTGRESLFPPGVAVGTCPPEVLARATDKRLLGELARQAGLDVPPTLEVRGGALDRGDLTFPAIVKPRSSVEETPGADLRYGEVERVDDAAELRRALARAPGEVHLVQPYVEGRLAAICGVAWGGELVCAMHQQSPRIWPPERGISSFAVTVAPDPEREAAVGRLLGAVGWSGVFGVQFLVADERAYLIDLNPRIYGSVGLAVASGLNLPAIWADLLLGRSVSPGSYRVGVHYRVGEDDYRALWHQFRHGERLAALRGLLPRPHTVGAVLALRDPAPVLTSFIRLGSFLRRRRQARAGSGL